MTSQNFGRLDICVYFYTCVLTVAPHFVLRPVDNTMAEGSTAVFQCDATGDPTPIITWYKNGTYSKALHPHVPL